MNTAVCKLLGAAALVSLAAACGGQQAAPATQPTPAAMSRAQVGDTVYLVDHYVRADRRAQFEEFVDQVLWPAIEQQRTIRDKTRVLKSEMPNEDGFYTYTFVLDPVVAGERYNVLDFLRAKYPAEEAFQHYVRFTETWGREFTTRRFVQAR